jgi:hypothetical protein
VFWWEENLSPFDGEKFITEVKTLWAKWALTMTLRWSRFEFNGKKLLIFSATTIWAKKIATAENIAFMHEALEKLWFFDIEIEMK